MIHLYHCTDARSFRPLWALEELGLPYTLAVMPFPPRYRAKDFMAVNPLGAIPAMRDGETFMTESAAIVQYLATRYGPTPLVVDAAEPVYGAWLNWLHFEEATLTFPQTLVLRYRRFEPGKAEVVADDYAKWFLARLRAVDRAVQDADWLAPAGSPPPTSASVTPCCWPHSSVSTQSSRRRSPPIGRACRPGRASRPPRPPSNATPAQTPRVSPRDQTDHRA